MSAQNKAIFLDRDGTINRYVPYLHKAEDFELLPGVAKAIKLINQSGYLCIIITNQPMIAMSMMTEDELGEIHGKLKILLQQEGAYIDDIFFCPHKDKAGLKVLEKYDVECNCAKPKPGLFIRARDKYNIDLCRSYMVGDRLRDMEAAVNAGCIPVYVGEENYTGNHIYKGLLEFVEQEIFQSTFIQI